MSTDRSSGPLVSALGALVALVVAAGLLVAPPAGAAPDRGNAQDRAPLTARFAASAPVPGTGELRVSGRTPTRRERVVVEARTRGAWVRLGGTRSRGDRRFSLTTPFGWYGTHRLRVRADGATRAGRVRVAVPYAPSGQRSSYRFRDGTRARTARFDPCRTLRYQVNAAQVPPEALGIVRSMMDQVSAATGIRTRYVGPTGYVPFADRGLPRPRTDLVIAWARDAEVPGFAGSEGTIGLGGSLRAVRARDSAGRPAVMTTQAGVVLQTEAFTDYLTAAADGSAQTPPVGRLVLHEVGHALGLAHVSSPVETMYFTAWAPDPDGVVRSRWQRGDLRGLALLGLDQGCLTPVRRDGRLLAAPAGSPVADTFGHPGDPDHTGHLDHTGDDLSR